MFDVFVEKCCHWHAISSQEKMEPSERRVEALPFELRIQQEINNKDKFKRIDFVHNCSDALENNSKFLKRMIFLINTSLHCRKS